MEIIRWVTTPKCSACIPKPDFSRRASCRGCYKLTERGEKRAEEKIKTFKHALSAAQRFGRDREIAQLREQGVSYGAIAKKLGLPRSTVQCAAQRAVRAGNKDLNALY